MDEAQKRNVEEFAKKVARIRDCGVVTLIIEDHESHESSAIQLIDNFVQKHGFHVIDKSWVELSWNHAEQTMLSILQRDLAYNMPLLSSEAAKEVMDTFFGYFAPEARYFTNGNLLHITPEPLYGTWQPLTAATFDTGIVCFDPLSIGILWVQDED